jgi:hypothetical protein
MTSNTILLRDFNLDWNNNDLHSYQFIKYFDLFYNILQNSHLPQMINFHNWLQKVNGVEREPALDHLYITDPTVNDKLGYLTHSFGDHKMVHFEYRDLNLNTTTRETE